MTQLFSAEELLAATGGRAKGLTAEGVSSISIDSRDLGPNALFVAIRGDRFDGHDFVGTAFENGAAAALVSEEKGVGLEGALVIVPDSLEGLADLGRAARQRSSARIVAVTGSVGKTTTKEALRTVFEAAGSTHASLRSFNNHWGVPLTLARLPRDARFGVFEIGMNHAGEITPLVRMVRPHIAVVTTVAPAHLEAFDSVAGIARAKAEIFLGLEPGGIALLNADHDQLGLLREEAERVGAQIVTYGFAAGSDWQIADYERVGESSRAIISNGSASYALTIAAAGRHMIANATAALAAGVLSGINPEVALAALSRFGATAGRGQKVLLGDQARPLALVDESYNANTASMLAALEVFAGQEAAPGGAKVVVLGDMLELGASSADLHASLAEAVIASGADRIYLVGEHMAALAKALGPGRVTAHAGSVQEIGDRVLDALAYGDAVMVKGSNGVRLAGLVDKIRDRFQ